MQADTVRRWQRQGIWHHLKWRRGRKRPGRPPIPAETRKLIHDMSRDNVLWGAPRICGELAKLGINVSPTTVAKYKVRHSYSPSPAWRTFIRNQAPDLAVAEVYAELSGRARAVTTRIVRAFRHRLWQLVSGCLYGSGWRLATPLTERHASSSVPIVLSLDMAEYVRVCERSPPTSQSLSGDDPFHVNPPIDMGRVEVRPEFCVAHGCTLSPSLSLTPQAVGRVQRTDASEQAAAKRCRRMNIWYGQDTPETSTSLEAKCRLYYLSVSVQRVA
jgi:hypothetical protein